MNFSRMKHIFLITSLSAWVGTACKAPEPDASDAQSRSRVGANGTPLDVGINVWSSSFPITQGDAGEFYPNLTKEKAGKYPADREFRIDTSQPDAGIKAELFKKPTDGIYLKIGLTLNEGGQFEFDRLLVEEREASIMNFSVGECSKLIVADEPYKLKHITVQTKQGQKHPFGFCFGRIAASSQYGIDTKLVNRFQLIAKTSLLRDLSAREQTTNQLKQPVSIEEYSAMFNTQVSLTVHYDGDRYDRSVSGLIPIDKNSQARVTEGFFPRHLPLEADQVSNVFTPPAGPNYLYDAIQGSTGVMTYFYVLRFNTGNPNKAEIGRSNEGFSKLTDVTEVQLSSSDTILYEGSGGHYKLSFQHNKDQILIERLEVFTLGDVGPISVNERTSKLERLFEEAAKTPKVTSGHQSTYYSSFSMTSGVNVFRYGVKYDFSTEEPVITLGRFNEKEDAYTTVFSGPALQGESDREKIAESVNGETEWKIIFDVDDVAQSILIKSYETTVYTGDIKDLGKSPEEIASYFD